LQPFELITKNYLTNSKISSSGNQAAAALAYSASFGLPFFKYGKITAIYRKSIAFSSERS
jgi:hypothetical protein